VAEPDHSSRRFPLVAVTRDQLSALLSPLLKGHGIGTVEGVYGGLTNTILRVSTEGNERDLLVRIFAGGRAPWDKERRLLAGICTGLPVPTVLLADEGRGPLPYPSLVHHWIEGVTLNAVRSQTARDELLPLAEALGRILAEMSKLTPGVGDTLRRDGRAPLSSPDTLVSLTQHRLLRGRARLRLGESLADALWKHFSAEAGRLWALGPSTCLVHGDLGGRNILVAPDESGGWRIAGIVDWEDAFAGWAMWDVGSVFRYARRYDQKFRERFERSYRGGGGMLPGDWWTTARLLDATREVATLDGERELPAAFGDCREILEAILQEGS
jgi:aminoglycoside phosphotransferase (APT) family kinase protein